MAITKIDNLLESLNEDYLRSVFAERLENTRLNVDDEAFVDTEGAAEAIRAFLALTKEQRQLEVIRVRIAASIINWANNPETSLDDINSIITLLRVERDKKTIPEPEPEPETEGSE